MSRGGGGEEFFGRVSKGGREEDSPMTISTKGRRAMKDRPRMTFAIFFKCYLTCFISSLYL